MVFNNDLVSIIWQTLFKIRADWNYLVTFCNTKFHYNFPSNTRTVVCVCRLVDRMIQIGLPLGCWRAWKHAWKSGFVFQLEEMYIFRILLFILPISGSYVYVVERTSCRRFTRRFRNMFQCIKLFLIYSAYLDRPPSASFVMLACSDLTSWE